MPLYEYVCVACEEHFDARRGLEEPDPSCPTCGQDRVRRQFSVFASQGDGETVSAGDGCACGGACACGR